VTEYINYVITFHCSDRLGVMARFASLFYESGAFITSTAQQRVILNGQRTVIL